MTEEEIDKMADNFVNTQDFTRVYSVARKAECGAFWKYGFLAGLKAGKDTNVPTKWHDLRKDPNDLPKRNNELTDRSDVIITDKGITHYNFRKRKWYVHNFECDMSFSEGVIAWCEIPTFTDKE